MGARMLRKGLAVAVILLFIGMSVVPSTAVQELKEKPSPISFDGDTLYVGGSGPNNYTTIQSAIDDAVDGDTVFVYDDSSPYKEELIIDKSINLIGEDRDTTVLIGMNVMDINVITILANKVTLSGFTIKNATRANTYGVEIFCGKEVTITDNIFVDNYKAIYIHSSDAIESSKNIISYNIITDCGFHGICIGWSSDNVITHNVVHYCVMDNRYGAGIRISSGKNNIISYNDVRYNGVGIVVDESQNATVKFNNVMNNFIGISTFVLYNYMRIINNNIYQNERIDEVNSYMRLSPKVRVNGNYWGDSNINRKIVPGLRYLHLITLKLPIYPDDFYYWPVYLPIPIINIDWNPAQEPYDIEVL